MAALIEKNECLGNEIEVLGRMRAHPIWARNSLNVDRRGAFGPAMSSTRVELNEDFEDTGEPDALCTSEAALYGDFSRTRATGGTRSSGL